MQLIKIGSALTPLAAAMLLMTGCQRNSSTPPPVRPAQPEIKTAPPTPIAAKKEELGMSTWNHDWDRVVEQALPPQLLSNRVARDVRPFCPRFSTMDEADRRAYWAYFFQALAGAEAGLQPTTDVQHTEPEIAVKDGVTKRMVRSEGLLQLTYMDAKRYGCNFDWNKDSRLGEKNPAKTILQPENNLQCGVRILFNQLIIQHKPLLSRTSYWSTLQPARPSYRVFAKQMTNVPAACKVAPPVDEAGNKPAAPSTSLPAASVH